MNRLELTEQMRRLRQAEERDPAENALLAFIALSDRDKLLMAEKYNSIQAKRARPSRLSFTPSEAPA